jgi:hypothetical protein
MDTNARDRVNGDGEGKRGCILSTYLYENRTIKHVETVLRKRRQGVRENNGGGDSNQSAL